MKPAPTPLNPFTLTLGRFSILKTLANGPRSLAVLARAAGVTAAAMTGIRDAFISAGLATAEQDVRDRRIIVLTITDEGLAVIKAFERTVATVSKLTYYPMTTDSSPPTRLDDFTAELKAKLASMSDKELRASLERVGCKFADGPSPSNAGRTPHRCPVCEGHGNVAGGFFNVAAGVREWSSTTVAESCRPCGGTGIIYT